MVDDTSTDSPTTQRKTLPVECLKRLQKFDEALTALEVALAPILQVGFEDHMKRSALEMTQVDVMTMFVMNSLGWCLSAQRGLDPKDDVQLADELLRDPWHIFDQLRTPTRIFCVLMCCGLVLLMRFIGAVPLGYPAIADCRSSRQSHFSTFRRKSFLALGSRTSPTFEHAIEELKTPASAGSCRAVVAEALYYGPRIP
ncbi:unnamed protein product [Nippostrongylus brasiliensis]|uniref:Nuclear nucleic acid-binding protein C1D (inferred by orthology to a human protein) n=1 Tax=Nippostrongylus brasiliensis TaxID=27835 RepID=A0A158R0D9_NIPBR|nr:unnamed protein product [Nippostrongylus brasiliensis]